MKSRLKLALAAAALLLAVQRPARAQELPRTVSNVELLSLDGKPASLPQWGKQNLMIFYVDPDRPKQNSDFTDEMEQKHLAEGANLYGLGVLNLSDSALPNSLVRSMARKRTEKNGATVLADQQGTLRTQWGLGDCNNLFVLLLVSKEGKLVYVHKGVMTEADKAEFYRVLQAYK